MPRHTTCPLCPDTLLVPYAITYYFPLCPDTLLIPYCLTHHWSLIAWHITAYLWPDILLVLYGLTHYLVLYTQTTCYGIDYNVVSTYLLIIIRSEHVNDYTQTFNIFSHIFLFSKVFYSILSTYACTLIGYILFVIWYII